ncbi:MAG: N-acetylmuramic acid 6-phosphate etherase [Deltaproteobacteria bacterium]|nr:N-acetylmuramic acid 6-phosphate etherase [Deltaproteobacteria bacterium]
MPRRSSPKTSDVDYGRLPTEQSNPAVRHLDTLPARRLVRLIHEEDQRALAAVAAAEGPLAEAVELVAAALDGGGRLLYVGAGTSGRLAALDAAECPPTYGTPPSLVQAVIAGGRRALLRAVEGAEDSLAEGRSAIRRLEASPKDAVCGITASGVTPFVLGALAEARLRGCRTLLVTCAPHAVVAGHADLVVSLPVGPEIVAGSTRMKAGLATKAVLHTLTTASMIRLGKVYDNLMVDVRPTNRKLVRRATRIVQQLTGLATGPAAKLLAEAGQSIKVAAVMHRLGVSRSAARVLLRKARHRLRDVIGGPP